jgi:tryptophan halogenase
MFDRHSSSTDPIRKIVIVGGGTAGWMSAASLASRIASSATSVTLIELDPSDDAAVGAATIASIRKFNRRLGFDENDFVRQTRATSNRGIEFVDWTSRGDRCLHSFGPRYALQLDARLYAEYLRKYSTLRGVRRIKGKILHVRTRREDSFISRLVLRDGRTVDGDLFLDCSGVRALLIGRALKVGFEDWHHWLPCDRVVAASSKKLAPLLPYARVTADVVGWRWRIPLQHCTGNRYVYSSEFISDIAAQARLLTQLDADSLGDVRLLKFTAGHRRRFWERNCVAIGPAAGIIEPLELTCIHLIQAGIAKLLALFAGRNPSPGASDAYNRYMANHYCRIRDRNILYYKMAARYDTPFWRHCREMSVPESLQEKVELLRDNTTAGRIRRISATSAVLSPSHPNARA